MLVNQKTSVTVLENGNITAKVTDVYDHEVMNYDWVLQNMSPETVKELIVKLSAVIAPGITIKRGTKWVSLKTDLGPMFKKGKVYTAVSDNHFIDEGGHYHEITDDFIEGNFSPAV